MAESAADPYAWTETAMSIMSSGACVALIRGCPPARALAVLVPSPATEIGSAEAMREWAYRQDYRHYGTAVEAGDRDGWTLVVEINGFQATRRELLETLARDGEAVVIYRNVNAVSSFAYAKNGTVIREFDPLIFHDGQIGAPLPQEAGIPFGNQSGDLHPMRNAFTLMERLTGIRLTEQDLLNPSDRIAVGLHPADFL